MQIEPSATIRIAERIKAERVGEAIVILSMAGSEVFELTGSGPRVWELLQAEPTVEELLAKLTGEYGAEAPVADDTRRLLGQLAEGGLVVIDGGR